MKAVRVHAPGGPEALRYEDAPEPRAKAGEAVVRIAAAGVNFIDVYHRTGAYAIAPPFVPGREGAGVVAEVAPDVTAVRPGDRVASVAFSGSYAERAVAPAEQLVPIPVELSFAQAAAAMLQGMTAHYLALATYPLRPGETCLVHAAAGGVGQLLCQIARRRGARVIGTAGGAKKVAIARAAGADAVIDYETADFAAEVVRLTGGAKVQVVYDSVGKTTFEKSLDCLALRGTMVLFGQSSGAVGPMDPQILNVKGSLYLTRPTLFHYVARREELLARAGDVLGWVRDGSLRLAIDRELPLAAAAEAHTLLESRKTAGKVLLVP